VDMERRIARHDAVFISSTICWAQERRTGAKGQAQARA
jgi:hypothetical protein